VGTVAAGVVKAGADIVQIAGADGGTGASPLSSIKHAGLPWELGLAETQQVLSGEGLRGRVRLRVDGGLKTGRDVLVAALLGADEFSFGTAALLAEGCIMVRTCHLDTCPVGIATQRPELRARFAGTPEMVAGYLTAVAEHVRRLLASLGLRSLDDAVGRTDLLTRRSLAGRAARLDPSPLLEPATGERRAIAPADAPARSSLGDRLFADAWPRLLAGDPVELEYRIANADRSVGARLGGAIGRAFGDGAPAEEIRVRFTGVAGQSFGAFLTDGVAFHLTGEANDYVGKGMSGGRITIEPPPGDAGEPSLAGNTLLYGATGGELYVAGSVGERFAVRNSGARAVVEGTGANAAEYLTGGTLVILGSTGPNLGAGMTGGEVFLLGVDDAPLARVNPDTVEVSRPDGAALDRAWGLLNRHARLTGSPRATEVLAAWPSAAQRLWHVRPRIAAVTVLPEPETEPTVRVS
jgi:glutamate synthase (ferredoxin)